nr:type III secretion system cytoplasmic ring protein SctQ [uncultured Acetobacter sp.]
MSLPLASGLILHDRVLSWNGTWVCYEGHIGRKPLKVFVAEPLLVYLAGRAGGGDTQISPEMQAIFSVLAVEADISRLEQKLGAEVRFISMEHALPSADARHGVIEAGGQSWPVAVQAPFSAMVALMDIWPPAPLPAQAVFIRSAIRIGKTTLPFGILSSLHLGDVVLFEDGCPEQAALMVENYAQAQVHWAEGKGWVLETAITYPETQEGQVTDQENGTYPAGVDTAPHEVTSEAALPVTISFEMGQQTLSLAELRNLGPSSILVLPSPVKTPIRLCVGGRQIGTGELVDVDGAAGVRVVRIFGCE